MKTPNRKCKHKLTNIAPEYSEDGGWPSGVMWRWCIRCGALKLGAQVYLPGPHQNDELGISERERKE